MVLFGALLGGAIFMGVGILIGHFAILDDQFPSFSSVEDPDIGQLMLDECRAENIEENLR